MEEKVSCPYCGTLINNDIEQCPKCKEWFKEPALRGFKLKSLYSFICLDGILLPAFGLVGLYSLIWIHVNSKVIKSLASQKDCKKFEGLLAGFSVLVLLSILVKIFCIPAVILGIFLNYRILRIFEKYSYKMYNVQITHHELGMIVFGTLYVVYFMDTYAKRIYEPNSRYHFNLTKWSGFVVLILLAAVILSFISLFVSQLYIK